LLVSLKLMPLTVPRVAAGSEAGSRLALSGPPSLATFRAFRV